MQVLQSMCIRLALHSRQPCSTMSMTNSDHVTTRLTPCRAGASFAWLSGPCAVACSCTCITWIFCSSMSACARPGRFVWLSATNACCSARLPRLKTSGAWQALDAGQVACRAKVHGALSEKCSTTVLTSSSGAAARTCSTLPVSSCTRRSSHTCSQPAAITAVTKYVLSTARSSTGAAACGNAVVAALCKTCNIIFSNDIQLFDWHSTQRTGSGVPVLQTGRHRASSCRTAAQPWHGRLLLGRSELASMMWMLKLKQMGQEGFIIASL